MWFAILGPLEVVGERGPVAIRSRRLLALLGLLLLRTGQAVPLDDIVESLWPQGPPASAVDNVRTHVSSLRRLLDQIEEGAGRTISSHPGAYQLTLEEEKLDLLRFSALCSVAETAMHRGDYPGVVRTAGEVMTLWRGQPLQNIDLGPEVLSTIRSLEDRYWATFSNWVSARFALGEHEELIPILRSRVEEHPLDERGWADLAAALHAVGRTGDALAACSDARQVFIDELGIEPGTGIADVQAAILRGASTPAGRIGPSQVPVIPHQLPPMTKDFVGRTAIREQILQELTRLHQAGATSTQPVVVTVSGQPGIGKTAMTLSVSHELATLYPDGQLFVPLQGSASAPREPHTVLEMVLTSLGWNKTNIPDSTDARLALYRSTLAQRHVLVVLDDAQDADQARPLLPSGAGCLAIVTSRHALTDLDTRKQLTLNELNEEGSLAMLASHLGADRVRAEEDAARAITTACGGLPLAIRIVGIRMAARAEHSLTRMADTLRDETQRLNELSVGNLTLRERFCSSYRALPPSYRAMFRLLGTLDQRSITVDAVSSAFGLPERTTEWLLEGLLRHGLVFAAESDRGTIRYRMPTLIHLFARECATTDGTDLPSNLDICDGGRSVVRHGQR